MYLVCSAFSLFILYIVKLCFEFLKIPRANRFIVSFFANVGNPGVISVFENKERMLHTTHSWEFMGFEANGAPTLSSLQKKANFGEGVIIANLDTGKVLSLKLQWKNLNSVHIGSLPIVILSYIFWLRTITIGVWPESKSFNDEGMGPVPSRWKGTCQAGGGFKCNKSVLFLFLIKFL
jgi:hypothetical protein